jgi:hypothetical protein
MRMSEDAFMLIPRQSLPTSAYPNNHTTSSYPSITHISISLLPPLASQTEAADPLPGILRLHMRDAAYPFAQKRGSTARSRRLRFWEVQSRDRASDTTGITLLAHEALIELDRGQIRWCEGNSCQADPSFSFSTLHYACRSQFNTRSLLASRLGSARGYITIPSLL